jgi:hypothetical protein
LFLNFNTKKNYFFAAATFLAAIGRLLAFEMSFLLLTAAALFIGDLEAVAGEATFFTGLDLGAATFLTTVLAVTTVFLGVIVFLETTAVLGVEAFLGVAAFLGITAFSVETATALAFEAGTAAFFTAVVFLAGAAATLTGAAAFAFFAEATGVVAAAFLTGEAAFFLVTTGDAIIGATFCALAALVPFLTGAARTAFAFLTGEFLTGDFFGELATVLAGDDILAAASLEIIGFVGEDGFMNWAGGVFVEKFDTGVFNLIWDCFVFGCWGSKMAPFLPPISSAYHWLIYNAKKIKFFFFK